MTSGGKEQFNGANEDAVISLLCLSETGGQAALPWFPVWSYVAMGTELTSIFFGHTLIGWRVCLQLFNLLFQPDSETHTQAN